MVVQAGGEIGCDVPGNGGRGRGSQTWGSTRMLRHNIDTGRIGIGATLRGERPTLHLWRAVRA